MIEPTVRTCWICGAAADSDEHRRKRSDLVARYGINWRPEQQPFVIGGSGSRNWMRLQGPNDRKNVYQNMLCCSCNNAGTKPFDQAYQAFSEWVLANTTTLHDKAEIDFVELFGETYALKTLDLLRYFAKSLGCRIVHAGIDPPVGLRHVINDVRRSDTRPLTVTFAINEFWYRIDPTGRVIGDDYFISWAEITDSACFSWVATLGYLDIFYWYDLAWEDGYPLGGEPMWAPSRRSSLGRYDPLPDEPEASMKG